MNQSFPSNEQLAVMKGVLDGEPLAKIAQEQHITVKEANSRYKLGMKTANLRTLRELVIWGLTSGVIQDPPRTDLAKAEIDKGYSYYPIWLRVLQAMTTDDKPLDIATQVGIAKESLTYYQDLIRTKFLLGPSPTTLIRFAFQVTKPIAPPTSTQGWRSEGLTGDSMQVLVRLAQGMSPKEIAGEFNQSEKTISYHIEQLKNHFNVQGHGNAAYAKLLHIVLQKRPDLLKDRPVNLQAREQFILHLPEQQKIVFCLLAQGIGTEEAARQMGISRKTVEYHRAQLFGNLGITNIQDLTAMYVKYKDLVDPDDPTYKQQDLFNEMAQITRQGKIAMAGDKLLKLTSPEELDNNIVLFRFGEGTFFAPGTTYVYFMDSDESAQDMRDGKIDMLMFPYGTKHSGGSPITDIWKKRFQKEGTEHILGVLEANTNDQGIYLAMLSVRNGYRRNSIARRMIDYVHQKFPNAEISHSQPTDQGRKFLRQRGDLEARYQTAADREWQMRNLTEGFHDKAKLEVFHYAADQGHAFWFFRNGRPAGEIQMVAKDGRMLGFGVQRSLQGTGFGKAMLQYAFEKTGFDKLTFDSAAHAFYHKIGGKRRTGSRTAFILDKDKFKGSPLKFTEIPKEQAMKYLLAGPHVDPWPSRN